MEKFSKQHAVTPLVWYGVHRAKESAITREKRIKKWNRAWKMRLIVGSNPYLLDL
ncbi:MAG: hypothetical protein ABIO17_03810 [Pseudoxanthomonas sp.]